METIFVWAFEFAYKNKGAALLFILAAGTTFYYLYQHDKEKRMAALQAAGDGSEAQQPEQQGSEDGSYSGGGGGGGGSDSPSPETTPKTPKVKTGVDGNDKGKSGILEVGIKTTETKANVTAPKENATLTSNGMTGHSSINAGINTPANNQAGNNNPVVTGAKPKTNVLVGITNSKPTTTTLPKKNYELPKKGKGLQGLNDNPLIK